MRSQSWREAQPRVACDWDMWFDSTRSERRSNSSRSGSRSSSPRRSTRPSTQCITERISIPSLTSCTFGVRSGRPSTPRTLTPRTGRSGSPMEDSSIATSTFRCYAGPPTVYERLYSDSQNHRQRRVNHQQQALEEHVTSELSECTFRPDVAPTMIAPCAPLSPRSLARVVQLRKAFVARQELEASKPWQSVHFTQHESRGLASTRQPRVRTGPTSVPRRRPSAPCRRSRAMSFAPPPRDWTADRTHDPGRQRSRIRGDLERATDILDR